MSNSLIDKADLWFMRVGVHRTGLTPKEVATSGYRAGWIDCRRDFMRNFGWQEIETELPEVGLEVLVFCPHKIANNRNPISALTRYIAYDGAPNDDYYWDNYYGGGNTHIKGVVTHWMPLPSPPE